MIGDLEEMRIAIIKNNDEKKITLDQYEEEQPAYQRWRLAVTAMNQVNSKMTGMSGGVIEAIQQGARKPIMKGSKMQIPPASTLQGGLCVEGVARDSLSENDVYLKEPPKNIWPQAACLR